MPEIIVANSASEVLQLTTDFYGREKAKEFIEGLIINTRDANRILQPPIAPIAHFGFLFTKLPSSFAGYANLDDHSIELIMDSSESWLNPRFNRAKVFHEIAHHVREQHRILRGGDSSWSTKSRLIHEGTAQLTEEDYCGMDIGSKYHINRSFTNGVHRLIYGKPLKMPDEIRKGDAALEGTKTFPYKGYAFGHYIVKTAAQVSGLNAKELLAVPDSKIIAMVKKYI